MFKKVHVDDVESRTGAPQIAALLALPPGAILQLLRRPQASALGGRIWRPLYLPVFRSMWCGRRRSPESLSSM